MIDHVIYEALENHDVDYLVNELKYYLKRQGTKDLIKKSLFDSYETKNSGCCMPAEYFAGYYTFSSFIIENDILGPLDLDNNGRSLLHLSTLPNGLNANIVLELLNNGFDPLLLDNENNTPYDNAIKSLDLSTDETEFSEAENVIELIKRKIEE